MTPLTTTDQQEEQPIVFYAILHLNVLIGRLLVTML
jgi:hypothetical protein